MSKIKEGSKKAVKPSEKKKEKKLETAYNVNLSDNETAYMVLRDLVGASTQYALLTSFTNNTGIYNQIISLNHALHENTEVLCQVISKLFGEELGDKIKKLAVFGMGGGLLLEKIKEKGINLYKLSEKERKLLELFYPRIKELDDKESSTLLAMRNGTLYNRGILPFNDQHLNDIIATTAAVNTPRIPDNYTGITEENLSRIKKVMGGEVPSIPVQPGYTVPGAPKLEVPGLFK